MAVTNIPISKQGYKRLEEELARLKSERPAIIQAIKEAREEGDLRENAGYDAARERQGMAEARIKYIESRMALYQVVDLDKLSGDKVIFGSTVEVEDVDTEESQQRMAAIDAKLAEKKEKKPTEEPIKKEEQHEREDH